MHILILLFLEWRTLEEQLKSLCSVLLHNYHERLNSIPELLKDGGEQLSRLVSSSPAKINEKIITYLIVKLCYNDSDTSSVRCSVMDKSVDLTDTQQIRFGTYDRKYTCTYMIYSRECILYYMYTYI